ncbi:MAG: hypothetical protein IMY73_03080 [Bacteroidetes bacterium]|nr:hypothetical protein [Bacteroidota bacterium]
MLILKDKDETFIEVDCYQHGATKDFALSNIYLHRRNKDHIIAILCDGGSNDIMSHIKASMAASMAVNSELYDIMDIAKTVVNFITSDKSSNVSFSLLRIFNDMRAEMVEHQAPPVLIFNDHKAISIKRQKIKLKTSSGDALVYKSNFTAKKGYMMLSFTKGVVSSGKGSHRIPNGWSNDAIKSYVLSNINKNISARKLSHLLITKAVSNDLFQAKNDMSSLAIYIRKPRKILICTGPPYNKNDDVTLAEKVKNYDGDVIISGGTTASIISRELDRDVHVVLNKLTRGLPPKSEMEGVTLVTEGVLTLNKVKERLTEMKVSAIKGNGTDIEIINKILEHDIIEFIVGTRINALHQNPNIPTELAIRRNVVKDIAHQLQDKFMKGVTIQYL